MKLTIKVPATSANIGPGFDVAGLALNLYNTFTFDFDQTTTAFFDKDHTFDTSLTLDTFYKILDSYHIPHPTVHLNTDTQIPIARGLGSSSTCIVAGVLAANQYAHLNLNKHELAKHAASIEGHPDNIVPALYGNLNMALFDHELFIQTKPVHQDYGFIAIIPHHEVSTHDARKVLPQSIKLTDLTHTQSRTAFLLTAFSTYDETLIKTVTQDIIHEPYRKQLIKNIDLIESALSQEPILTYWVSGAGPTIMVLVNKKSQIKIEHSLKSKLKEYATTVVLQVDTKGAIIE